MAQIEEPGERDTNVELNLVPFIDLMSVCIIFLLITAVWTQVSMIQIGSSVYGKKAQNQTDTPPPETVPFRLFVKSSGYNVRAGSSTTSVPKVGGKYDDTKLAGLLSGFRKSNPDTTVGIISLEDDLTYENLIHGMDMLMAGGFTEISVATGEGN